MSLLNIKMAANDSEYTVYEPESMADARDWLFAEAWRRDDGEAMNKTFGLETDERVDMGGVSFWIERF